MKKQSSIHYLIFAIAISLFISSCSTLIKPQTKQTIPAASRLPQTATSNIYHTEIAHDSAITLFAVPRQITIVSPTELSNLFNQLKYSRDNCIKDDCELPRVTFNGISKTWKETTNKLPVKLKKELFFQLMAPLILIANENIKRERYILIHSALNSDAVKTIALKYQLIKSKQEMIDESLRAALLSRVDILPPSLALAQAAEESGWATSRFTIEGNAFFGQWDFSGKGMKPLAQRKELGNYGIARFASPLACVEGYMLNINRNTAYQKLRSLRAQLRAENKPLSGYQLAQTLDKYSERGQAYIDGLQSMIRYNKLAQIDQATLANNKLIHLNII